MTNQVETNKKDGIILKGIGGFYYVETADGVFECKAKGKFRKEKIIPLAGDRVTIEVNFNAENTISEIKERKNFLRRPPVANIDQLLIVVSMRDPEPNTLVIDKMTALAEKNGIEPILVFSKTDLASAEKYIEIYKTTGYKLYTISPDDHSELDLIKAELSGKLTAFTGNSGAGKSTLINALSPDLSLDTGEISNKLKRGRHTTRQAEIFHVGDGLIIDTAGFSSIDLVSNDPILKDELVNYFPEFSEYLGQCKFTSCSHTCEKGCVICEKTDEGIISKSRHDNYVFLYNEAKNIKEWELSQ
ncbi:MAG: ribosome small subunit-dependent GTPase A [Clostridia bacterium]|nr:ribosome small subunit-dependent GTPase A [Clostridia bacterium]